MPVKTRLTAFLVCFGYLSISASYGQTQSNGSVSTVPYDPSGVSATGDQYSNYYSQQQQGGSDIGTGVPRVPGALGSNSLSLEDQTSLQQNSSTSRTDLQTMALRMRRIPRLPVAPPIPLQQSAAATFGTLPPIFGQSFFRDPFDYMPLAEAQVPDDYILAPGDEVVVGIWGSISLNRKVTVDRSGSIYLPRIGSITVAGVPFKDLQNTIRAAVDRVYRNYNLSVELGHLRTVQVFVTGAARQPGSYTVSAFSTMINALFVSGGPSSTGSFRRVQLRRGGETVTEFDLYRFLRFGDKSKDVRLMAGDVLFIPPVGEQVAIGGSVKDAAVYELLGGESVEAALSLAGGKSNTAAQSPLTIERIVPGDNRTVLRISTAELASTPMRNGDIVFVPELPPSFKNAVTLRGNVVQPGRFTWRPGLKLSDIMPEKDALLTKNYWTNHNRLSTDPDFQPLVAARRNLNIGDTGMTARTQSSQQPQNGSSVGEAAAATSVLQQQDLNSQDLGTGISAGATPSETPNAANNTPNGSNVQYPSQSSVTGRDQVSKGTAKAVKITIPAPDIDWSYAVIERKDPVTLKSTLVPFNLGKLVLEHDLSQDKELQPEDVVTIFSQADVTVPRDQQTKFVRVEGEVTMAGVYAVENNETWMDVLRKAGGLTANAYPYGAEFTRESARISQQQRLDDYVQRLTAEVQHSVINVTLNGGSASAAASSLPALQTELLRRIQNQKATGRVVLNTMPNSTDLADLPHMVPEDGDVLMIPPRPSTVNVIGAVNNQSSYIFTHNAKTKYYVALAGGANNAGDQSHAFVIRANGSIVSKEQGKAFSNLRIAPGDTIVIPEKAFKISKFRMIFDSSLTSQFTLLAAVISTFR
ncbi:polysaccharide biosynthesis/export family protein [Terriglobus albidus]|uniref:polysaccharide biosynthesis/export family protein n=1 Tax=Terriglobus albidus TaxID=1592106 RepID=UPI0021E0C198|nr:polysaccharide biosynthesis/export family protein [Terriglobus albidus]